MDKLNKFWNIVAKIIVLGFFSYLVASILGVFWAVLATIALFIADLGDKNKIED